MVSGSTLIFIYALVGLIAIFGTVFIFRVFIFNPRFYSWLFSHVSTTVNNIKYSRTTEAQLLTLINEQADQLRKNGYVVHLSITKNMTSTIPMGQPVRET